MKFETYEDAIQALLAVESGREINTQRFGRAMAEASIDMAKTMASYLKSIKKENK